MSNNQNRKTTVNSLLQSVQQREPIIPEMIVKHFLEKAGCRIEDPKAIAIVSLATEHFLSKILDRTSALHGPNAQLPVLTMEDLLDSLNYMGVPIEINEYLQD